MRKPKPDLKQLQLNWYAKLAKSGFVDIEDTSSQRQMLKRWDSTYFENQRAVGTPDQFAARQRYFELATDLLNYTVDWTARERKIWALHCEGLSTRKIAAKVGISHEIVSRTVRSLRRNIVWK